MKKVKDLDQEDEIQQHLEEIEKVPDVSGAFQADVIKHTAHINAILTRNIIRYNKIASKQTKYVIFLNWTIVFLTFILTVLTFVLAAR